MSRLLSDVPLFADFFNFLDEYICELKIWYGPEKHKKGIGQLAGYLERQNVDEGYLVVFDFKKEVAYKQEKVTVDGKEIFVVWV